MPIKVNLNPNNMYRRDPRVAVFQDKKQECLPAQVIATTSWIAEEFTREGVAVMMLC